MKLIHLATVAAALPLVVAGCGEAPSPSSPAHGEADLPQGDDPGQA